MLKKPSMNVMRQYKPTKGQLGRENEILRPPQILTKTLIKRRIFSQSWRPPRRRSKNMKIFKEELSGD